MSLNKSIFKGSVLETKRCIFEEVSLSRLDDIHDYSTEEIFYKHLEFPVFQKKDETKNYLLKTLKRHSSDSAFYWFIILKETNKAIGIFGVHDIDWRKLHCEISYGISPKYWKKKIFSEIVHGFLSFIFSHNFYRVCAVTSASNIASIYSLKKMGFLIEATFKDYYLSYKNFRYDACYLALLKSGYKQ
tara:strand:- start:48 stop:611 length:564 start_codon:yes stop_codon:yes gene_type:complete